MIFGWCDQSKEKPLEGKKWDCYLELSVSKQREDNSQTYTERENNSLYTEQGR